MSVAVGVGATLSIKVFGKTYEILSELTTEKENYRY